VLRNLDQQLKATNGLEGSLDGLTKVLPPGLIQEALDTNEKSDKRIRKLPLRVVMWLVVGMSLYRDLNIQNVLRRLVDGLGLVVSWGRAEVPHTTSIAHARDRLGWATVRELYRRFAAELRDRFSAADRWKDLMVYAIDGTCFSTADTPVNEAEFGRPGGRTAGAFPQFRGVLLMGAWSHLVFGGLFGHWRMGELTLATHLLDQVPTGSLLLVDRLYYSFAWLAELAAGERFFVVRAKTGKTALKVRKRKALGRGEWTGVLPAPASLRKKAHGLPVQIEVRVIKLRRKGFRDIELVTNLPADDRYTAAEIATLYLDRWEIELGIREIKCVLGENSKPTFRSHKPDRVKQETYGLLLAYNCVRALMAEAAELKDIQPRRLSFTDCLAQIRVFMPIMAHVDVSLVAGLYEAMLDTLAACELPPRRRGRTCRREVRVKMSKYKKKWKKAA
jgi:hypothetical protein